MRTFTLEQARERFGDLIDHIKVGAPLGEEDDGSFFIEHDGKPVGLVLARESLHHVFEQQDDWMKAAIAEGVADLEAGNGVTLETEDDVRAFFDDIRRDGRERLEAEQRACRDAAE